MPYTPDLFPLPLFTAAEAPREQRQLDLATVAEVADVWGAPVSTYTRAEALADGVLIDPATLEAGIVAEAGFLVPVAITRAAWHLAVWPLEDDGAAAWLRSRWLQDPVGRLWDVLHMARLQLPRTSSVGLFKLSAIVATPTRGTRGRRNLTLKAVIAGGDDGAPCITIMLPEED